MLLIRDERNSITQGLAYQAQRLADRSGEVVWYVTTKLTAMGGWNSAEYQLRDHNRDEDQGRSAGQGMEAKGETMKEYWTVRRRGGSDSERAGDKRLAMSV